MSHVYLLLAMMLAAGASVQEQAADTPQLSTVEEVVALNLQARGGVDLLRATETMKMTGTVSLPRGQAKMTVWLKRPDRKRTETTFAPREGRPQAGPGGERRVEAYDGATPWVAVNDLPPQVIPPSPQLEEAKGRSDLDPVLLDYEKRGREVTLVGRERLEFTDVYHLRIAEKGRVTHYYIDAATGLDKRMTNRITSSDGMRSAEQELRFSDFRNVQGRMVPFRIQQVVDGRPVAETRLETVEFNVPIDETIFQMPSRTP